MADESSPLLPSAKRHGVTLPTSRWQEFVHLSCMAAQVGLSTVARVMLTSIDSIYLGHLGVRELAAASLAHVWTGAPLMAVWASALITRIIMILVCTMGMMRSFVDNRGAQEIAS
uniref:Uncharacterized protein n=1 Tax=Globisporangium ultimum (strain ATCC 200006 / CBS 805.95 / DAOM BR144) TaxID=431595 RepID=K3XC80_GLOUD